LLNQSFYRSSENPDIFPKNSNWNENNYGPLKIPKTGDTLNIDSSNIVQWEVSIKRDAGKEESYPAKFMKDVISRRFYVVKKDYYFVLGDYRDNSLDSRFWGFVAMDDIIGKTILIFYSYDDLLRKIRWERIGKKLK
jgi:signal peptidase I